MYRYFDSHSEYNRPGDGEMNAKILKGKAVAETLSNQIALDVEDLSSSGKMLCLVIHLIDVSIMLLKIAASIDYIVTALKPILLSNG